MIESPKKLQTTNGTQSFGVIELQKKLYQLEHSEVLGLYLALNAQLLYIHQLLTCARVSLNQV